MPPGNHGKDEDRVHYSQTRSSRVGGVVVRDPHSAVLSTHSSKPGKGQHCCLAVETMHQIVALLLVEKGPLGSPMEPRNFCL